MYNKHSTLKTEEMLETAINTSINKGDIDMQLTNLQNASLLEFVNYWIDNIKANNVKSGTLKRLQTEAIALKDFDIAYMNIKSIKLLHIQNYINQLVNKGYAYTTIAKQRLIVTAPLKYAYQIELLDRDVTSGVKMPNKAVVLKPTKDVSALVEEEQVLVREILSNDFRPISAILSFILETGMRVGEAQAITWNDINWQRRCVTINKTVLNNNSSVQSDNYKSMGKNVQQYSKNIVQLSAKTISSKRTIPLSSNAISMLKVLYSNRKTGFVFSDTGEEPLTYNRVRKRFNRVCEKAGIPKYGLHALRHTFATNMYYKGCDVKLLSKLLGHSSTNVTYNTYVNLYGDGLEDMRSVID